MGNDDYEGHENSDSVDGDRQVQESSQNTGIPEIDFGTAVFGLVAQSISQIVYYKFKIRELEIRRDALKNKLKSDEIKINTISKIELEEIEKQSVNMENGLTVVANKIKNEHIEKERIIDLMTFLAKAMIEPNKTIEEKQLCHETIKTCSETLRNIGSEGVASLKSLAETTIKAVEASYQKRSKFNISYSPDKMLE